MVLHRSTRRWLGGLLVLAILFTQFATAAYACPGLARGSTAVQGSDASTPCDMDPAQPGLCRAHCQFGSTQTPAADVQLDAAPVAALLALFLPGLAIAAPRGASAPGRRERARRRDRSPPRALSILHCCFRI